MRTGIRDPGLVVAANRRLLGLVGHAVVVLVLAPKVHPLATAIIPTAFSMENAEVPEDNRIAFMIPRKDLTTLRVITLEDIKDVTRGTL